MLALSPQFCSVGWLLDESISHDHQQQNMINYLSTERQDTSEYSIDLHSPNSSSRTNPKINDGGGDENKTVKKLNHNASERDRRKKINNLYSSLRSLLPNEDQSRKLSIPATVSRVVKYIPEIQKEVEKLIHKKEMMTTKMTSSSSSSSSFGLKENQIKQNRSNTNSAVTTTPIGEREIVIQMSTKADYQKRVLLISEAVMSLEEEGFLVTNATSFESFDARIFYTLHIQ
ncbi:hypothetical protein MIMGU_mgv1a022368mg, partial [Erythranthe guttata]